MNHYYLGTLEVVIGDYTNNSNFLLVAQNRESAARALDKVAREHYSDPEPKNQAPNESGAYASHGGKVLVTPRPVQEISAEGFDSLRNLLSVRFGENAHRNTIVYTNIISWSQSLAKLLNSLLPTERLSDLQVLSALEISMTEQMQASRDRALRLKASPQFEYLMSLPRYEAIGRLYETDEVLREALNTFIPEFDYPYWADKTIGDAVACISPPGQSF